MNLPAPVTIPPKKASGFGRAEGPLRQFCRKVASEGQYDVAYMYPEPTGTAIPKAWLASLKLTVQRRPVTPTGTEAPKNKTYVYVVRGR